MARSSRSQGTRGSERSTRTGRPARTARSQRSPAWSICRRGPRAPGWSCAESARTPEHNVVHRHDDGYRFQAILTDQADTDIAVLECRHRQHAHVEDRIRDDKDTGLSKFPFKEFALNEVWLEIVMLAHDLIVWTQALALDGALAKAEPKRLRYQLLHVAGRLAFSGHPLQAPPPGHMAVDGRAPRRVSETQNASHRERLTAATSDPATTQQTTRPPGRNHPAPKRAERTPRSRSNTHKQRHPARSPTNKPPTHQNSHAQSPSHAYCTFRASVLSR